MSPQRIDMTAAPDRLEDALSALAAMTRERDDERAISRMHEERADRAEASLAALVAGIERVMQEMRGGGV